jgi:hypothetical protein
MKLSQSLEHHLDMLQMMSPIHVMYVDIINKDFQEMAIPIFKNLCHKLEKSADNIFQPEWHNVQFIKI